jgi:hypothetical protein
MPGLFGCFLVTLTLDLILLYVWLFTLSIEILA